jgi:hypothetical protein
MPTILGLTSDSKTKAPSGSPLGSSIAKPGTSNSKMGGKRLDTISKRNHHAAVEIETLLWRALCDSPEEAKEYLAKDCIMINPLFSGSNEPMSRDTEPSLDQVLEGGEPWTSFRMHGQPKVVEIDLMAVAVLYRVSLYRQGKKGLQEIEATVSSSWRQTAGADWLLCAQHVAYAD